MHRIHQSRSVALTKAQVLSSSAYSSAVKSASGSSIQSQQYSSRNHFQSPNHTISKVLCPSTSLSSSFSSLKLTQRTRPHPTSQPRLNMSSSPSIMDHGSIDDSIKRPRTEYDKPHDPIVSLASSPSPASLAPNCDNTNTLPPPSDSQESSNKRQRGRKRFDDKQPMNATVITRESGLDAVTPNRAMPYLKQLMKKQAGLSKVARAMLYELNKRIDKTIKANKKLLAAHFEGDNADLPSELADGVQLSPKKTQLNEKAIASVSKTPVLDLPYSINGLPVYVGSVAPSPVQSNYRNKNEFTVGYFAPGEATVGFSCGRFINGETRVAPPDGCLSAPTASVRVAKILQEFITEHPIGKQYAPYSKEQGCGFYRQVTIRDCLHTKQLMVTIQISPRQFLRVKQDSGEIINPDDINDDTLVNADTMSTMPLLPATQSDSTPHDPDYSTLDSATKTVRLSRRPLSPKDELLAMSTQEAQRFTTALRDYFISRLYGGRVWDHENNPILDDDGYKTLEDASNDESKAQHTHVLPQFYTSLHNTTEMGKLDCSLGQEFTQKYSYSLASLMIQCHTGVSNAADTTSNEIVLFGKPYIHADICGSLFRVANTSFLQVNRLGAETLYNTGIQWALAPKHNFDLDSGTKPQQYCQELNRIKDEMFSKTFDAQLNKTSITPTDDVPIDPQMLIAQKPVLGELFGLKPEANEPHKKPSIIFDICCGTGTIGILASKYADYVVGIDNVSSAIEDAKRNAVLNGATNCEFICAKAEDAIEAILKKNAQLVPSSVAIVDPPRSGLHKNVIKALRKSDLQRVVYISCNPNTLAENMVGLCCPSSGSYPNAPFVPIVLAGVDMFPHTTHCEAVMLFERRPVPTSSHETASMAEKM